MRQIRFFFIFALFALLPSLAFALKEYRSADCESWKGSEIRCLLNDSRVPTATIEFTSTGSAVSFTVDEWHSVCGTPGGKVESNTYSLSGGETRRVNAQNPGQDPRGNFITCREIFITDCKEGGQTVDCNKKLKAKYTLWVGNKQ